jgi:excisionase family DNA binding protein
MATEEVGFYRAREVADLLGVDVKTVYVWVRSGSIAHIRTPTGGVRIRGEEVRAMLAGQPVLGQEVWAAQGPSEDS